jgi:putative salt-induced outer membrane protein YdiY
VSVNKVFIPALLLFSLSLLPLSAEAVQTRLELINGDALTGELSKETDSHYIVQHPVLGELSINKSQVMTVAAAEQSETDTAHSDAARTTVSEPEVAEIDDNGLFGTGILTHWKRRLDLGLAGSAGKSRNHQVNLGFSADFDTDYTRISSRTAYFRAKSDGVLSDHSFYSTINRDWLRPGTPWFHFAGGRADWDEFKDWDLRVNANGGVGYEFAKTDTWLLLGRSGLGFNQTFGGEREEFTPEGLIGVETKWDVNDYQRVEFSNSLYPSLRDMGEYRNLTAFDWVLDLNSYVGVALKLGLLNEYDSATEEGISKNDFKYTVSLAWKL